MLAAVLYPLGFLWSVRGTLFYFCLCGEILDRMFTSLCLVLVLLSTWSRSFASTFGCGSFSRARVSVSFKENQIVTFWEWRFPRLLHFWILRRTRHYFLCWALNYHLSIFMFIQIPVKTLIFPLYLASSAGFRRHLPTGSTVSFWTVCICLHIDDFLLYTPFVFASL